MAKWSGKIGFAISKKVPGKGNTYIDEMVEHPYFGDVISNTKRWESGESINDEPNISNTISVVANAFAIENLQCMKYVEFCGAFWKINSVDVQMPRLILRIGGAWNGETATT